MKYKNLLNGKLFSQSTFALAFVEVYLFILGIQFRKMQIEWM